jgi:hypothetical protein
MEHGLTERECRLRQNHKVNDSILRDEQCVDTHIGRQRQEMDPSDPSMAEYESTVSGSDIMLHEEEAILNKQENSAAQAFKSNANTQTCYGQEQIIPRCSSCVILESSSPPPCFPYSPLHAARRAIHTDRTTTFSSESTDVIPSLRRYTSSGSQDVAAWRPSFPMTASCASRSVEESCRHLPQTPTLDSFPNAALIACMIPEALRETRSCSADTVESQQDAESTVRGLQHLSASPRNTIHPAEKRPPSAARQKGDAAASEAVWRMSVLGSIHGSDPHSGGVIGSMPETARSDECKVCNTSSESVHAWTRVSPAMTGQYGTPNLWNARSHNALQTFSLFTQVSSRSPEYRIVEKGSEELAFYEEANLSHWGSEMESEVERS